jgi:hypothetical protein
MQFNKKIVLSALAAVAALVIVATVYNVATSPKATDDTTTVIDTPLEKPADVAASLEVKETKVEAEVVIPEPTVVAETVTEVATEPKRTWYQWLGSFVPKLPKTRKELIDTLTIPSGLEFEEEEKVVSKTSNALTEKTVKPEEEE